MWKVAPLSSFSNKANTLILLGLGVYFTPGSTGYATCLESEARSLKVGLAKLPSSLDPLAVSGIHQLATAQLIHRNLVQYNGYGEITPSAAKYWDISGDRRRFNFCVDEFTFDSGKKLALDDVQFSFLRLKSSKLYSDIKTSFDLDNLQFLDNHELKEKLQFKGFCFTLLAKKPIPNLLNIIAHPLFALVTKAENSFAGLGDFRYLEPKSSAEMMVFEKVRNDSDHQLPRCIFLKKMPFDIDTPARLERGEIDIHVGIIDQQKMLPKLDRKQLWFHDGLYMDHLYFSLKSPMMRDREFRRDFGKLLKHLYETQDEKILSLSPVESYLPIGLAQPAYYMRKKASGMEPKQFIQLWKGHFPRSHIRLLGCFNELGPKVVESMTKVLNQIDIQFEYLFDANGPYLELLDTGKVDAIFIASSVLIERPDSYVSYPLDRVGNSESNFAKAFAPFRTVILEAAQEIDDNKRAQLLSDAFSKLEEEYLFVPFFSYRLPIVVSKRVVMPNQFFKFFFNFGLIKLGSGL